VTDKHSDNGSRDPIVIVGGGIIGLALGWQLLRRRKRVTIVERDRAGRAASWIAAGMLAPHSEVGFEEEDFLQAGLQSLKQYPRFLDELEQDSGRKVSLDSRGTLIVAFNRDDSERIRRLYDFRQQLGLPVEWFTGSDAIDVEPSLSAKTTGAIWLPDDSQVNNRSLVDALKEAFARRGGVLRENTNVTSILLLEDRAIGVKTNDELLSASRVVLAAGCWSGQIGGVPTEILPPVRPVKGQLVSLCMDSEFKLAHVIRAPDVYIIPKDDGRVIVGATQEEMGFDTTPTAGPVMRMLERGWEAVPSIYDLAIDAIEVGLRPGSRDNAPIIGASPIENLYYATGHFRHGILLAPLTAYALTDLIVEGVTSYDLKPFATSRFFATKKTVGKRLARQDQWNCS